jgi:hypothetical protein
MLGIIIQLLISWLIVWLFEKRNLSVLGFLPTKARLMDFFLFLLITAIFCSTAFLLKMYFGKQQWHLNPDLSAKLVMEGIWWNIKSVLFEELIFRGVLLFILIRKLGSAKAVILSAIAFGVYHWFSFGIIGNWGQMVIVFFITGTMGLLLAYGYSKTFSLYIPIAIHLGWNFTQIFIFSQGPIGNGILMTSDLTGFRTNSYLLFFSVTFLPLIMVLLTNYLLLRQRRQVNAAI